ncbi:response regulator [Mariprofundus erugo]|uniref:Response regulator n=1 Tax=Mariprofundus erugo TaxID=2528639 RepID=A0A5R9GQR5_9PROT|nr:response regulator [Mariprofundus erugo]TLS67938.1 response regulator [Mariprofundus erugo]
MNIKTGKRIVSLLAIFCSLQSATADEIDKSMEVLIVDDSSLMRTIDRNLLGEIGIKHVTEAGNAEFALESLKSRHYDFVLLSWRLNGTSGLNVLSAIRNDPDTRLLPVIVTFDTNENTPDNIATGTQAGVNNYLTKPFTANDLRAKLEHTFNLR